MRSLIITAIIALVAWAHTATAQEVININEKEFIEKVWDYNTHPDKFVYRGTTPCIIDFYADWCGPCRILGKNLNTIAHKYNGKVIIYKVDIDAPENASLATLFNIRNIPYIIFANSSGAYNNVGVMSVEALEETISTLFFNNKQ